MILGNQTVENYINQSVIYRVMFKRNLITFSKKSFYLSFDFIRLDNEHGFGWGKSLRKQCMAI